MGYIFALCVHDKFLAVDALASLRVYVLVALSLTHHSDLGDPYLFFVTSKLANSGFALGLL